MTIRILYTIPNFITAGSGYAMLSVARRLDPERFTPSICVLRKGGSLEKTIEELGIPLLELPFTIHPRPLPTLPLRAWSAAQKFRPYHFDLWQSLHYSDDYTEALIARMAGARAWIYVKKNMGWGSRAWKLRTMFATRIAAQNTTMLEEFFTTPRAKAKTRLVPRGVEADRFRPGVEPRLHVREQLGLDSSTVLIGCVAHLIPVKGHPTLLRALANVPNAHLLLAGKPMDEDYTAELHRICAEVGITDRVHFLDNVSDVPALNAELDIFVLPTLGRLRMEGCPVALLEAMSSGLVCVATRIPGSKDIIEDGKNGLLVTPENVESLTGALQKLVSDQDLRQKLGAAARERILSNYTIEREVRDYEQLYTELF